MRVTLLADRPGWIVERCMRHVLDRLPAGVSGRLGYYTELTPGELAADDCDVLHYGNWGDLPRMAGAIARLRERGARVVVSVRSHRCPWPSLARDLGDAVHVPSRGLLDAYPGARVIPDGVEPRLLLRRAPRVGFAGVPDDYKGHRIARAAAAAVGAHFLEATGDISPSLMPEFYRGLDLVIAPSVAEGFGAVAMECLALGVPLIATRTGALADVAADGLNAAAAGVTLIEPPPTLDAVVAATRARFAGREAAAALTWERAARDLAALYAELAVRP